MEKGKTKVSIDLYPADDPSRYEYARWNMLEPHVMEITLKEGNVYIEIMFEGKRYITDRNILKGVL